MDLKECVDNGVRWLDEVKPGWAKKIKIRKLDMSNLTNCIVGQVFGKTRFSNQIYLKLSDRDKQTHGFFLTVTQETLTEGVDKVYNELKSLWLTEIRKRTKRAPRSRHLDLR